MSKHTIGSTIQSLFGLVHTAVHAAETAVTVVDDTAKLAHNEVTNLGELQEIRFLSTKKERHEKLTELRKLMEE